MSSRLRRKTSHRRSPLHALSGTLAVLAIAIAVGAAAAAEQDPPASKVGATRPELYSTVFDGLEREALIYRPAAFKPGSPAVMLLHGGGRSMRKVLTPGTATARWLELADREGLLLIVPNGVNARNRDAKGDQQTWNDPRGPEDGRRSREDDVAFLTQLADELQRLHGYDTGRLYVTGASNGGMMSMRLAMEAPAHFAAAAAFIAALPEKAVKPPPRATPIMMLNGTEDALVLWEGGPVAMEASPSRSVEATVAYFLASNGLTGTEPEVVELPDADPDDGCRIIKRSWKAVDRAAPAVVLYEARGGGHLLPHPDPIELGPRLARLLGTRCRDAHGVDLAWRFLAAHRRD